MYGVKLIRIHRKWLMLLAITCWYGCVYAQSGRLYAVLVGVAKYEYPNMDLMYADRDAVEMYNLLKFQTAPLNLRLLTDEQATKSNILTAADELFTSAKPNDIVVFFFSGHGVNGYFYTYDKYISFKELKQLFQKIKARRKLIFADACMSGTLRTSPQNTATISSNYVANNVLLFLSSRSDQSSVEWSTMQNGVFTYFLLAGLRGGADSNSDRLITAKELFNFVNPKVKEHTNGRQIPVMWGKFDDNLIITNWKINK